MFFYELGLARKYLKGLAYDGVSVMSGAFGGIQCVIKKDLADNKHQFVPYVHCPPHQVNIVLVHAE